MGGQVYRIYATYVEVEVGTLDDCGINTYALSPDQYKRSKKRQTDNKIRTSIYTRFKKS